MSRVAVDLPQLGAAAAGAADVALAAGAVRQAVARLQAPDAGRADGTGRVADALHLAAAALGALQVQAGVDAALLEQAAAGYAEADRRAVPQAGVPPCG